MSLELVTPPASEPVTLAEAKAHLRVDTDDEDALITRLIRGAREIAERQTGGAFVTQSWIYSRDAWRGRVLEIPRPPLAAVTSVTLYGRSGAATVLSSDAYIVDSAAVPGRIVLKDTTMLPADLREANAVAVAFDAGYGDADDVPAALKAALLALVAHLYEARGDGGEQLPPVLGALLAPFKVMKL